MIRVEVDGDLHLITLNRPDKANALTLAMLVALEAAIADARAARVVILTGAGTVFSAGADLDEAAFGLATDPVWARLSTAIAALPGLTIACLNGTLAGGAFGMVLACDLRLAVPEAQFFYPVMRRGYLPQPGDPERLVALIGPARARMILLAGARVAATEALHWGLIDRIADAADLLPAARALAANALAANPGHGAAIKAMLV